MDKNALTEKRRETVIGLLKGMNIKKASGEGFDKDDVYECMQQLCDLYEKNIEELEDAYEGEIVALKDKYQKYDDNNDLYVSLIMEAKKSSNEIINQAKDEVENILSEGREEVSKQEEEIEQMLCNYLGCEKVLWIKDGIDPDETNGHIDDVACFIAPGEVACIWTEDKNHPFYEQAQAAYKFLSEATDAKGRKLKVHKLCLTKKPCLLEGADTIDAVEGTIPREDGEVSIASYMNFLIVNGAVILPQYGDENDAVAIEQVRKMFPDREVVGVQTKEVAFGGGNIHCITQQQPAVKK